MSVVECISCFIFLIWIVIITSVHSANKIICQRAGINFTNVEKLVEVRVNQRADVPCGFEYHPSVATYTNVPLPFWRLVMGNGEERNLFPEALFPNFYYEEENSTLVINKVDQSLDNSSLTCCFDILRVEFEGVCESDPTIIRLIKTGRSTLGENNSAKTLYAHWVPILLFEITYHLAL